MDKPVVILGGGFAGTLLALKLKELQPGIAFTLYEESSSLGGNTSCIFRESDCKSFLSLLKPFISYSWPVHQFKSSVVDRWISSPLHMITPESLHTVAFEKLKSHVKLNNEISLELALQDSSFVIDTRDTCYFRKAGFVHELSLEIELENPHYFKSPVLFDGESCGADEYFSYFPLNDSRLIISHSNFHQSNRSKRDDQFNRILNFANQKGFRISKVVKENCSSRFLPVTKPYVHQESRVISLAGFMNPTTGCRLTALAGVIDKMTKTSFRYGELKALLKKESQDFENRTEFYLYLNQQVLKNHSSVFEAVFDQSQNVIDRFYQNKLSFLDRSRIIYGHSHRKVNEMAKLLIPMKFYPPIQAHKTLLSKT